ncbi:superinfection immunity protein [Sanguibacter hominis ATCC BAA-789]|uniref:Superinfection immunity protein n=1 Tax=Sanguibacter hominis ATCC BAA-789 TaxID=1312740 RepID=A0A9X5FGA5_9MICO|nr:superinfection immunity protein [Sanguibacter hominis]NKX93899.1 superinfection immunity protein [Sanguibacter hominis ATCC BAA-789]
MSDPYSTGPFSPQPYPHAFGTTWGGAPAYVTDRRVVDPAVVVIAWVLAVLTGFYTLPWAIAATRGRSNHGSIALLNVLLGWTFIGWIVALVMACQSHAIIGGAGAPFPATPPGWYPSPQGGQEFWDGVRWTGQRAL